LSDTVKVAWPFEFVVPLTVLMFELPLPAVSVTALLPKATPPASFSVTVIVEPPEGFWPGVLPLSTAGFGVALTVELPAFAAFSM
jgi:hypothetical protein